MSPGPPETNAKLVEIKARGRAGPRATRGARAPATREAVSEGRGRTPRGQRSWARAPGLPTVLEPSRVGLQVRTLAPELGVGRPAAQEQL